MYEPPHGIGVEIVVEVKDRRSVGEGNTAGDGLDRFGKTLMVSSEPNGYALSLRPLLK